MKIPMLLLLLLATPLLAAPEAVPPPAEKISTIQLVFICASIFLLHGAIMALPALLIGIHIIRHKQLQKILRKEEFTSEEKRLHKYCLIELIASAWVSAILVLGFQLWQGMQASMMTLIMHINVTLLIYEVLAIKINLRLFASKGIYHQVVADSWKKIKSEL